MIHVPEGSALSGCLADCLARSPRLRSRAVPGGTDAAAGKYVLKGIPVECPAVCDLLSDDNSVHAGSAATRVWIGCDSGAIRKQLVPALALQPELSVNGMSTTDLAALTACQRLDEADVMLLEWRSTRPGEFSSLHWLRDVAPRLRVLLLVAEPHPELVEELLRHRLHGYVESRCPPEIIARAIRAVAQGDIWVPRVLLAKALSNLLAKRNDAEPGGECENVAPKALPGCTSRERQILELVRLGHTNKEIARQLGIMEDTVKKHLHHVYNKLGVRRRTLLMLGHQPEGLVGA